MSLVVALVSDLLFTSKIRETATSMGVAVETFRDADRFVARAAEGSVAIVHLIAHGVDGAEVVRRVRAAAPGARIVAFGPHTAEDALDAARAAGADVVLTHGQLAKKLPELIAAPDQSR